MVVLVSLLIDFEQKTKWFVEGVVKNRLNVATDDGEENRIDDEETEPEEKWVWWLLY